MINFNLLISIILVIVSVVLIIVSISYINYKKKVLKSLDTIHDSIDKLWDDSVISDNVTYLSNINHIISEVEDTYWKLQ